MSENTDRTEREHSQAPAEGPDDQAPETQPEPGDERQHPSDPAEG